MSHSRYEQYARCGEEYRLRRIERVPTTPSIYAIAGSCFHEWTDLYDGEPFADEDHVHWWKKNLADQITKAELESGYSLREWDNPSRKPDANKSGFEGFRDVIGPDMIAKYIEWRKQSGWFIAELDPCGGTLSEADCHGPVKGIELEVKYRLGEVEGIAKIDRVFYRAEQDDLIAIDTKTWSRRRVTAQLPTYLVALRQNGFNVGSAAYYEARRGTVTEPETYQYWDENRLAALHVTAAEMISEGRFLPAPGENCRMCDVRRHCKFALD